MSALAKYAPQGGEVMIDGLVWSDRRAPTGFDCALARRGDDLKTVFEAHGVEAAQAFVYQRLEAYYGPKFFRKPLRRDVVAGDIKQALWEKGTSLGEIARANGVDRRDLGRAIAPSDDDALRQHVADALDLPLHKIWPTLYRADGSRMPRKAGAQPS